MDGFRFDEGSVLARDENGMPVAHPPVVWQIELDEDLMDSKVIAEAWDAAGLYQIGGFPGDRWSEWNGRYRDDIRRFVRGEPGVVGALATRVAGSSDLYQAQGETPANSINFVTCHDGFTMNDLVSYNVKHNDANGEGNRDGIDDNLSWNCGVEGVTDDPEIDALRTRQVKNFATILMLSRGVPMILAGDELRRTQRGNNNAYCQDNELSWIDWSLAETNAGLLRFWKRIIDFRKRHAVVRKNRFFGGAVNERGMPEVAWHGCRLNCPGWSDPDARVLAFTLAGFNGDADLHVMMNMYWETLEFDLPPLAGRYWYLAADTAEASPNDIADPGDEVQYFGESYPVKGRSIVVLGLEMTSTWRFLRESGFGLRALHKLRRLRGRLLHRRDRAPARPAKRNPAGRPRAGVVLPHRARQAAPERHPFVAREDARADLDQPRDHVENGAGRPERPRPGPEAPAVQFFGDAAEGVVLDNQIHHPDEGLLFGRVLFEVQAILGDTETVGDLLPETGGFAGGWVDLDFAFPLQTDPHQGPALVSLLFEILRSQRA